MLKNKKTKMEFINVQNVSEWVNHLVSKTWLFFLLGLVHLLVIKYQSLIDFIKAKSKDVKLLWPILQQGKYLGMGLILIYGSWTLTTILSGVLVPDHIVLPELTMSGTGFWFIIRHYSGFAGLMATTGFILSGIALLLSAGGRWLVNLSKLLATLTVLYLALTAFTLFSS